MKAFPAIFTVLAMCYCFQLDSDPESHKITRDCARENRVNLTRYEDTKLANLEIFKNHDFQCFARCMALKSNIVNELGEPNLEVIQSKYNIGNSESLINGIKMCEKTEIEGDICAKIFYIRMCIMRIARTKP